MDTPYQSLQNCSGDGLPPHGRRSRSKSPPRPKSSIRSLTPPKPPEGEAAKQQTGPSQPSPPSQQNNASETASRRPTLGPHTFDPVAKAQKSPGVRLQRRASALQQDIAAAQPSPMRPPREPYLPQEYKECKWNRLRPNEHGLFKLLWRWRGSVWQSTYKELIVWLIMFYAVSFWYRYMMTPAQKEKFESVSSMFSYYLTNLNLVPLSFVLGFYVQAVYDRWWRMWQALPWPDRFGVYVSAMVEGESEEADLIRRSLIRYMNLTFAFSAIGTSKTVAARYPTLLELEEDGLMTTAERAHVDYQRAHLLPHQSSWWIPLTWASNLIMRAYDEGFIKSDRMVQLLMQEMLGFRQACGAMFDNDLTGVPLIYTSVNALAVYSYFLCATVGRAQFLQNNSEGNEVDLGIPIFTILEFFVYVGWLKVAGKMLDPYSAGNHDIAYDLLWILHRNVEVGNAMVSHSAGFVPPLEDCIPLTGMGSTQEGGPGDDLQSVHSNVGSVGPRFGRMSKAAQEDLCGRVQKGVHIVESGSPRSAYTNTAPQNAGGSRRGQTTSGHRKRISSGSMNRDHTSI